jgi:hypothetical protein
MHAEGVLSSKLVHEDSAAARRPARSRVGGWMEDMSDGGSASSSDGAVAEGQPRDSAPLRAAPASASSVPLQLKGAAPGAGGASEVRWAAGGAGRDAGPEGRTPSAASSTQPAFCSEVRFPRGAGGGPGARAQGHGGGGAEPRGEGAGASPAGAAEGAGAVPPDAVHAESAAREKELRTMRAALEASELRLAEVLARARGAPARGGGAGRAGSGGSDEAPPPRGGWRLREMEIEELELEVGLEPFAPLVAPRSPR